MKSVPLNCWGPRIFIELLILFALPVGWVIVWVLDRPEPSPGP